MTLQKFIIWAILAAFWVLIVFLLSGCMPDIPNVPTGAFCAPDGYVMALPEIDLGNETLNSAAEPVTQVIDYVYDDTGAVLRCEFTYD
jgi:hypothetical protein